MSKFQKNEKIYMMVILILILVLTVKSLWIDEYKPKNDMETEVFIAYTQQSIAESDTWYKIKRIVDIRELPEGTDTLEHSLKYEYRIKVRTYLFGLMPYWEVSDYVYN